MREGAASRPVFSISFTPRANGADVSFICSRRSQVARLHTNSLVSSAKTTESLRPSLANITVGGWSEAVEERVGREIDLALGAHRADPADRPRRHDRLERIVGKAVVVLRSLVEHRCVSMAVACHDIRQRRAWPPVYRPRPPARMDEAPQPPLP